jgi:hypothetical protein
VGSVSLHLIHIAAAVAASLDSIGLFDFGNSELLFNVASLSSLSQPEEDGYTKKDNSESNTDAYTGLSSTRQALRGSRWLWAARSFRCLGIARLGRYGGGP